MSQISLCDVQMINMDDMFTTALNVLMCILTAFFDSQRNGRLLHFCSLGLFQTSCLLMYESHSFMNAMSSLHSAGGSARSAELAMNDGVLSKQHFCSTLICS